MIDELAEGFPAFVRFSESDLDRTGRELILAGMKTRPDNYLSFSLVLSLGLSFLSFVYCLTFLPLELSFVSALLSFSISFFFLTRLPGSLAKRRGERIESDLPVAIRSIAAELGIGVPFEKALLHASSTPYGIAPELEKAVSEINSGSSVPEALRGASARIDSLMVKRAIQQMIESYRHGSGVAGLKHLADELIEKQKAESREHNARIAFLGLLFVAVSCIVPALFQAYAVVGSAFLSSPVSAPDVWLYYLVLFPLANAMVLLAIYERTPKSVGTRKVGIFSWKQERLSNCALLSRGINYGFRRLIFAILGISAVLAFITLLGSFFLGYEPYLAILPFALPLLAYFLVVRLSEQRTGEVESRLPDALLQASSFPKGTHTELMMKSIAESGYGPLSEEFASASRQVSSGSDVPSALRVMAEGNDSVLLSRACELLTQAYKSGGDMQKAMRETAEDMFAIFSIVRERESNLALQKYTLLFGGGLIVPLVLGSIASVTSKLGGGGLDAFSSLSPGERAGIAAAAIGATQAYLVIYSLLASLFIAQLSGSWRNFVIYFVAICPLSLIAYSLALNFNVLVVS